MRGGRKCGLETGWAFRTVVCWVFADVRPELDGGSKEEGMWVHREPGDPGTARTGFQVTVSEVAAWRWWGDLDFVRTGSWGGFR